MMKTQLWTRGLSPVVCQAAKPQVMLVEIDSFACQQFIMCNLLNHMAQREEAVLARHIAPQDVVTQAHLERSSRDWGRQLNAE